MYDITVITPTIGRPHLNRLVKSLQQQGVKIIHLVLWDKTRCENGLSPDDLTCQSDNYLCQNYVIEHPVYNIPRIDNYLRSIGIVMATTPYITQIDDDCWLEPDWLSRAIQLISNARAQGKPFNYAFCRRNLWENESTFIGIDTYESIGKLNKFGYCLMETNSIVFTKEIAHIIQQITHGNNYGHDRAIAKYLIEKERGVFDNKVSGLNQIVPDFLLEFHRKNV